MATNTTSLIDVSIGIFNALSGGVSIESNVAHLQARTQSSPPIGVSSIYYSSAGYYSAYIPYSASSLPASYYSFPTLSFDPSPGETVHEMRSPTLVTTALPTHDSESTSTSGPQTTVHSTITMEGATATGQLIGTAGNTTATNGGVPKEACSMFVLAAGLMIVGVLDWY